MRIKSAVVSGVIAVFATAAVVGGVGVAEAAGLIGSKQIRNNSVKSVDVANKTLRVGDLSVGARASLRGAQGVQGEQGLPGTPGGPQGEQGERGERGPAGVNGRDGVDGTDGVSGYAVVSQVVSTSKQARTVTVVVDCTGGKRALGGGSLSGTLVGSAPTVGGSGWTAKVSKPKNVRSVTAYAVCALV